MQGRTLGDATEGATINAAATNAALATAQPLMFPFLPGKTVRHFRRLRQVADGFELTGPRAEVRRDAEPGQYEVRHRVPCDARESPAGGRADQCADTPARVHHSERESLGEACSLGTV